MLLLKWGFGEQSISWGETVQRSGYGHRHNHSLMPHSTLDCRKHAGIDRLVSRSA